LLTNSNEFEAKIKANILTGNKLYDMIYLLTAIGLSPVGRSTVHIYTQTIHRAIQNKQYIEQDNNFGRVRALPILASYTLAFALQPKKKHGKTQSG